MKLEYLDWDSTFFGKKIGKLLFDFHLPDHKSLDEALLRAKLENFDLIYLFCKKDYFVSSEFLTRYNGCLVDRKIIFEGHNNISSDSFNIVEYEKEGVDDRLLNLAYTSGEFSRYKKDSNFSENEFKRFYKTWIENSVNRIIADKVFVSIDGKGGINGMVTIKISGDIGVIGLIAVHPSCQGKGIGHQLVKVVQKYLLESGIYILNVATQLDNTQACTFYRKIGLKDKSISNVYHFWIK